MPSAQWRADTIRHRGADKGEFLRDGSPDGFDAWSNVHFLADYFLGC
jgi:hypothetical protein